MQRSSPHCTASSVTARCAFLFVKQAGRARDHIRLFSSTSPTLFEVNDKTQLLNLIKKHAKKPKHPTPERAWERAQLREQVSAEDSRRIVEGKKIILDQQDSFTFSCTACGACCHSAAGTVALDSHDVFLMSRSPSLSSLYRYNFHADRRRGIITDNTEEKALKEEGSTGKLFQLFPKAFTFYLARFHPDDPKAEENAPAGFKSNSGYSPALMLQAKLLPFEARERAISEKYAKNFDKYELCHFAYPAIFRKTSYASIDELYRQEIADNNTVNRTTKLRCALGPDHMPTPCAAYPLGDLFTAKKRPKSGASEVDTLDYYSLEVAACEGVNGKDAKTQTVQEYNKRTGLQAREVEWMWFLALNGHLVSQRLDKELMKRDESKTTREAFLYVIRKIWYDFDSTIRSDEWERWKERKEIETKPDTPPDQENQQRLQRMAEEWEVLKPIIWNKTTDVCTLLRNTCDFSLSGGEFVVSFQRFIGRLRSIGVALDLKELEDHLTGTLKKDNEDYEGS